MGAHTCPSIRAPHPHRAEAPPLSAAVVAVPAYRVSPPTPRSWVKGGLGLPLAYVDALEGAGGAAVLLTGGTAPAALLDRVDGLLLAGGGDIDPASYGAAPHRSVGGVDRARDSLELALARAAVERRLPLLAICRGMQVLNVALGGDLHQDLEGSGGIDHGRHGDADHPVRCAPGSLLASVCGPLVAHCASHHHQGVARLAGGLEAVGWSDDGLVEAVELRGSDGWLLGVQWHPERTAAADPVQQALFEAFVAAAAADVGHRPAVSGSR